MNLDQQRIRLCKEMQDPIALPSLESILSYVVTSNKDIEKIESERNQFKTVCGKSIQQNQISFQCFDCTLDAHHMYCGKCFIPEYHKGHKAIMRHNIGGCCDCGDNQTIPSPDSFCKDHKGFYVNLQSELQPTIAHLKQPIRNFIKMALEIYHIRMQSVKDSNIDYNLSIIYNHIWEYDFQIIMEAFKGQNEMVELFEKLWTCAHIYYVVMTLINYLSNNSMPFIMLLSQLLMEENEDEITYFEMIIRNQCLLEDYKLTNRIQFEQILYTLHGNLKFKQFMQQKYLQNYNRLYKFKEIVESRQEKLIQKMSIEIKLKEFMDQNLQIQYRNIIVDHIQQLQMREKTMLKYVDCLFIQHHTQFISEQFQQEFQNSRYIKNLFNSAEILYQQLIDSVIENPLNANQFQSVYHLRLEYPYFKKILIAQLERQLGENINIFKTELVNNLLLKQFPLSDWNQFKILGIAKQATWGQFNLQFRLEELRLQATGFLYQKSLYSNFAVNSLSRILDEVNNQIFQINIVRAHYSFLTNLMRNKEKFDIEMAYIKLRELPTIEQVNRYSFFYYQIIKNDNLLEYHFAQFSIIMFYYETTDFDKNKYLQKIKEVTGLNEEQIYQLNQAVIQKLLIEYVAIKELINTLPYLNNLYTQYEGGEESYESLESICLGFIRLFVYVYGQEGLNYVLDRLSVCLPLNLNFLLSHLLLSLIQSNIDQYNVMRYFYQAQLPQVFQDSINKFARNSFILKKQQSIIDITQYLRQLKAISNKNFSEYIKQTSEYDHQSGELKLKYGITQIYDPGLYLDSDKLKSNVFESLGEKRNEHINTILGNSVEEEMENFNNLDPIRQEIIRTILEYDQLDKVIEQSIYSSYVQGGEQFMFILNYLVRYLQFVKKLPQNEIREIVLKYQELFNNAEMKTIKQIEQCFKFFLQDLLKDQEAIEEQSKVVQKQQLKLQNLKEKFKNKMAKFEQQITNDAEQPQQIVENQIICYYCKQLIDDNSRACYPAQIKFTNIYDYFSFLDDSLQRYLNKKLNSTKIQLQCCSHILHVKCSNELIQNLILHGQLIQMNWISKKCITCQLPINIFFPYITNKNKQNDVVTGEVCKWFKENLIKFLRRDEIFMKMNDTEVLFTFYVNIVTDFTIKMFQDVDDFINKENSQYFETIFNTFQILFAQDYQTAKQLLQGYEKLKVDTDAELRLIYHILSSTLSQQGLPLTIELSDYEQKIQKILGNTIKLPQLQLPKVIVTAQEIKNIIQKKLIYELGESYDQFYFKHFYKKCTKCQSYPQRMKDYNNYSYEEMYVCLICFDILCRSACGETPTSPPYRGNLNTHAETKHKKDCIYLSIQSGGVALHSSYVILMNQRYLYSDELGVLINPNSPLKQNWKNFKLDMKTLSEISDMIYYQSIRQKIKQYQMEAFDIIKRITILNKKKSILKIKKQNKMKSFLALVFLIVCIQGLEKMQGFYSLIIFFLFLQYKGLKLREVETLDTKRFDCQQDIKVYDYTIREMQKWIDVIDKKQSLNRDLQVINLIIKLVYKAKLSIISMSQSFIQISFTVEKTILNTQLAQLATYWAQCQVQEILQYVKVMQESLEIKAQLVAADKIIIKLKDIQEQISQYLSESRTKFSSQDLKRKLAVIKSLRKSCYGNQPESQIPEQKQSQISNLGDKKKKKDKVLKIKQKKKSKQEKDPLLSGQETSTSRKHKIKVKKYKHRDQSLKIDKKEPFNRIMENSRRGDQDTKNQLNKQKYEKDNYKEPEKNIVQDREIQYDQEDDVVAEEEDCIIKDENDGIITRKFECGDSKDQQQEKNDKNEQSPDQDLDDEIVVQGEVSKSVVEGAVVKNKAAKLKSQPKNDEDESKNIVEEQVVRTKATKLKSQPKNDEDESKNVVEEQVVKNKATKLKSQPNTDTEEQKNVVPQQVVKNKATKLKSQPINDEDESKNVVEEQVVQNKATKLKSQPNTDSDESKNVVEEQVVQNKATKLKSQPNTDTEEQKNVVPEQVVKNKASKLKSQPNTDSDESKNVVEEQVVKNKATKLKSQPNTDTEEQKNVVPQQVVKNKATKLKSQPINDEDESKNVVEEQVVQNKATKLKSQPNTDSDESKNVVEEQVVQNKATKLKSQPNTDTEEQKNVVPEQVVKNKATKLKSQPTNDEDESKNVVEEQVVQNKATKLKSQPNTDTEEQKNVVPEVVKNKATKLKSQPTNDEDESKNVVEEQVVRNKATKLKSQPNTDTEEQKNLVPEQVVKNKASKLKSQSNTDSDESKNVVEEQVVQNKATKLKSQQNTDTEQQKNVVPEQVVKNKASKLKSQPNTDSDESKNVVEEQVVQNKATKLKSQPNADTEEQKNVVPEQVVKNKASKLKSQPNTDSDESKNVVEEQVVQNKAIKLKSQPNTDEDEAKNVVQEQVVRNKATKLKSQPTYDESKNVVEQDMVRNKATKLKLQISNDESKILDEENLVKTQSSQFESQPTINEQKNAFGKQIYNQEQSSKYLNDVNNKYYDLYHQDAQDLQQTNQQDVNDIKVNPPPKIEEQKQQVQEKPVEVDKSSKTQPTEKERSVHIINQNIQEDPNEPTQYQQPKHKIFEQPKEKIIQQKSTKYFSSEFDGKPVAEYEFSDVKLQDADEYGYGFWLRLSNSYPKPYTMKPETYHFISRMTSNKDYGDLERYGDRTLAIFLSDNIFIFTTYDYIKKQKNLNNMVVLNEDIESMWYFISYSYSSEMKKAVAFHISYGEGNRVSRVEIPCSHSPPFYLRLLIGGKNLQYAGFNGQFANIYYDIDPPAFINTEEQLRLVIKDISNEPQSILQLIDQSVLRQAKEFTTLDKMNIEAQESSFIIEEYALAGWFRWVDNLKVDESNTFQVFNLRSNLQKSQGKGLLGDRALEIHYTFGGGALSQVYFNTYTIEGNRAKGNSYLTQTIVQEKLIWTYVYFGYRIDGSKAFGALIRPGQTAQVDFNSVQHKLVTKLHFTIGGDSTISSFNGKIGYVGIYFGPGAYRTGLKFENTFSYGDGAFGLIQTQRPILYKEDYSDRNSVKESSFDLESNLVDKILINDDDKIKINGQSEYSFGLWTRWLRTMPKYLAKRSNAHNIARLGTQPYILEQKDQKLERVNANRGKTLKDQTLAVYLGLESYEFVSYDKKEDIPFKERLEGYWNYIYFGYKRIGSKGMARGYVQFGNDGDVKDISIEILHDFVNDYIEFVIGKTNAPLFNGYLTKIQFSIGPGSFIQSIDQLIVTTQNSLPEKAQVQPFVRQTLTLITAQMQLPKENTEGQIFQFDRFNGAKEISLSGWVRWNSIINFGKISNIIRLEQRRIQDLDGKENHGIYRSDTVIGFNTYSCKGPDCSGIVNKEVPFNEYWDQWTFIYYGYSYSLKKTYGFLKFTFIDSKFNQDGVDHFYLAVFSVIIGQKNIQYESWQGFMKTWVLNVGDKSYREGNFEDDENIKVHFGYIIGSDHYKLEQAGKEIHKEEKTLDCKMAAKDDPYKMEITDNEKTHIQGVYEYGYGYWSRFQYFSVNPIYQKPQWLGMSRLTLFKDYGDFSQPGDRVLLVLMGTQVYHFATYSVKAPANNNINGNIPYKIESEGEWIFTYFSYKRISQTDGFAAGFTHYGDITSGVQMEALHIPLSNYLQLTVGSAGKYYPQFNGQITTIRFYLGQGSYVDNKAGILNKIKSKDPIPKIIQGPAVEKVIIDGKYDFSTKPTFENPMKYNNEQREYGVQLWFRWFQTPTKQNQLLFRLAQTEQANVIGSKTLMLSHFESVQFSTYTLGDNDSFVLEVPYQCHIPLGLQEVWTFSYFSYSKLHQKIQYYLLADKFECKGNEKTLHAVGDKYLLYLFDDAIEKKFNSRVAQVIVNFGEGSFKQDQFLNLPGMLIGPKLLTINSKYIWRKADGFYLSLEGSTKQIVQEFKDSPETSIESATEYSFGLWTRFLYAYPQVPKLGMPKLFQLIRLTFNQKNDPSKIDLGDRILSSLISFEAYHFGNYDLNDKAPNELINIPYQNIEGKWRYIYHGYIKEKQLSTAFIYEDDKQLLSGRNPNLLQRPLGDYLKLIIGGEEGIPGFQGMIAQVSLNIGSGAFIEQGDKLKILVDGYVLPTPITIPYIQKQKHGSLELIGKLQDLNSGGDGNQIGGDTWQGVGEYSITGWFKLQDKQDEGSHACETLFRITNNPKEQLNDKKSQGDRTLAGQICNRQTVKLNTYTLIGMKDWNDGKYLEESSDLKEFSKAWIYIYMGYSEELNEVHSLIHLFKGDQPIIFKNIQHFVPLYMSVFVGRDPFLPKFTGQMQRWFARYGSASFVQINKRGYEDQLPYFNTIQTNQKYIWNDADEFVDLSKKNEFIFSSQTESVDEYSFGVWTRWLYGFPTILKERNDLHTIFRLSSTKEYADKTELGNRVLSAFVAKGSYLFSTYDTKRPIPALDASVPFQQIEGSWNYIYCGYMAGEFFGLVLFRDLQKTEHIKLQVNHFVLTGYAKLVLSAKEFGYGQFHGQLFDPRAFFGVGAFQNEGQKVVDMVLKLHRKLPSPILAANDWRWKIPIADTTNRDELTKLKDDLEYSFNDRQYVQEYSYGYWYQAGVLLPEMKDEARSIIRLSTNEKQIQSDNKQMGDRTLLSLVTSNTLTLSSYNIKEPSFENIDLSFKVQQYQWHFVYFGYSQEQTKGYVLEPTGPIEKKQKILHIVPNQFFLVILKDQHHPQFFGKIQSLKVLFGKGSYLQNPLEIIDTWPYDPKVIPKPAPPLEKELSLNSAKIEEKTLPNYKQFKEQ